MVNFGLRASGFFVCISGYPDRTILSKFF